jgi:hypothetical protein
MVLHCDDEELALLALGEDSPAASHAQECSRCSARLDELRSLIGVARTITPEDAPSAPPPQVWDRIVAEITPTPTVVRRRSAAWFALAAGVGVVLGGLGGALLVSGLNGNQVTGDQVASAGLDPLAEFTASGNARVVSSESGRTLQIDTSGLDPIDGYYEVWLLKPDASGMVSVGILDDANQGSFILPSGVNLADFPVVDVSIEEYDGDASHSAVSVVRGELTA